MLSKLPKPTKIVLCAHCHVVAEVGHDENGDFCIECQQNL